MSPGPWPNKRAPLKTVGIGVLGFCFAIAMNAYFRAPRPSASSLVATPAISASQDSAPTRPVLAEPPAGGVENNATPVSLESDFSGESFAVLPPTKELEAGKLDNNVPLSADAPLSADELERLRRLHAQQQSEIESSYADDATVVGTDDGNGPGMTVRELRMLQEQETLDVPSQAAMPGVSGGYPAMALADLKALHERQVQAMSASGSPADTIVVPDSVAHVTNSEIAFLHESQSVELESSVDESPATPGSAGGVYYPTLDQLRELHRSQASE